MTINRLTRRLFGASVAAMALMGSYAAASAADLNALIWCDHADPNLLKPFEDPARLAALAANISNQITIMYA